MPLILDIAETFFNVGIAVVSFGRDVLKCSRIISLPVHLLNHRSPCAKNFNVRIPKLEVLLRFRTSRLAGWMDDSSNTRKVLTDIGRTLIRVPDKHRYTNLCKRETQHIKGSRMHNIIIIQHQSRGPVVLLFLPLS